MQSKRALARGCCRATNFDKGLGGGNTRQRPVGWLGELKTRGWTMLVCGVLRCLQGSVPEKPELYWAAMNLPKPPPAPNTFFIEVIGAGLPEVDGWYAPPTAPPTLSESGRVSTLGYWNHEWPPTDRMCNVYEMGVAPSQRVLIHHSDPWLTGGGFKRGVWAMRLITHLIRPKVISLQVTVLKRQAARGVVLRDDLAKVPDKQALELAHYKPLLQQVALVG